MAVISTAVLADRLRSIRFAERLEFIADLWEARGYDTRIQEGMVVATAEKESVLIEIVDSDHTEGRNADIVVDLNDKYKEIEQSKSGAEIIVPSDLLSILLYSVERDDAETIVRRHLGLTDLKAPPARDNILTPHLGLNHIGVLSISLLLLLSLSIGFALFSPGGLWDDGTVDSPVAAMPGYTMDDFQPPTNDTDMEEMTNSPWLTADRNVDGWALIKAHWQQVETESHTVRVSYRGPSHANPFGNAASFSSVKHVDSNENYHLIVNRSEMDESGYQSLQTEIYHDSNNTHLRSSRTSAEGKAEWNSSVSVDPFLDQYQDRPSDYALTIFNQALAAPIQTIHIFDQSSDVVQMQTLDGRMTAIYHASGDPEVDAMIGPAEPVGGVIKFPTEPDVMYRITTLGTPVAEDSSIRDVKSVAYVTPEGRILTLAVTYRIPETGELILLKMSVENVGNERAIEPPEWVDRT